MSRSNSEQAGDAGHDAALWPAFAENLETALAQLEPDQYLIVSVRRSKRFVQFAAQGADGMRIEAASNGCLDSSESLDECQLRTLIGAGWHPPAGSPTPALPAGDPAGSPNFHLDFPAPVDFRSVAALAVTTLVEIFQVPHPGCLEYVANRFQGEALELPGLGLRREVRALPESVTVEDRLLATVAAMTGLEHLAYDQDGDIRLLSGSVRAYLRVARAPDRIRLIAVLLSGIAASPALLARLNEVNGGLAQLHLFWRNGAVLAVAQLPAEPFVEQHLATLLKEFLQAANGIDSLLQVEFGGTTSLAKAMPSRARH